MKKTVLIINSTWANPELSRLLTGGGYTVTALDDVRRGLSRLEKRAYDVIILRQRAVAESWMLCDKIRALTDAPLIVISPNASAETCVRAIHAGADYFLRKPFGPQELLARVGSLLYRKSLTQALPAGS